MIFITFDTMVEPDPAAAAAEFAEMHARLARSGTRVAQKHAVTSNMEKEYFLHCLLDDEVFVPVRAAEAHNLYQLLPVTPDVDLGWCTCPLQAGVRVSGNLAAQWAELTGFRLFVPRKRHLNAMGSSDDDDE